RLPLLDREQIRDRLARMFSVVQTVDDRNARVPRELADVLVLECTVHDAVDVTAQDARRVRDRLSAAQLQVTRVEEEGVPSELGHPDLERHASPRRRLLEDHREAPTSKRFVRLSGFRPILDAPGEFEQADEIIAAG